MTDGGPPQRTWSMCHRPRSGSRGGAGDGFAVEQNGGVGDAELVTRLRQAGVGRGDLVGLAVSPDGTVAVSTDAVAAGWVGDPLASWASRMRRSGRGGLPGRRRMRSGWSRGGCDSRRAGMSRRCTGCCSAGGARILASPGRTCAGCRSTGCPRLGQPRPWAWPTCSTRRGRKNPRRRGRKRPTTRGRSGRTAICGLTGPAAAGPGRLSGCWPGRGLPGRRRSCSGPPLRPTLPGPEAEQAGPEAERAGPRRSGRGRRRSGRGQRPGAPRQRRSGWGLGGRDRAG